MGSEDVVVAVIDSGVDYEHPDLEDNMWTNSEEIAGNSKDDDGNGYVDDVYGYDWIDSDSDPMDDNSHGTHVAGIIGAVGDNSLGVTGVSPEVSIMALRFMDADGNGTTSGVAQAITYAADNGADIINASFAGTSSSVLMEEAIEYASDKGVLFVAAAGNSGEDNDATPSYPASYDIDNILAVAATDSDDELASFSNYGETSVDMAAPGVSILSTVPGEDYETMSGTSMATPHVAGAAAVLLAEKPNLSVKRLRGLLKNKGRKLDSLADSTATGRRLRLNTSLNVIS
jgi:subtilisin family serine protease